MKRTATVLAAVAVGALAAVPSDAAPKKPIEKSWDIVAPAPDPTNYAGTGYSVCAQTVPGSFQIEPFTAPARGTIEIEITGFQGDWDLLVIDGDGNELGTGGSSDLGGKEAVKLRFKKKTDIEIVACNWAGSPNGKGKYRFVFG